MSNTCHVTWVLPDGRRIEADVAAGNSYMLAAQFEIVPEITGDCGGCLSCATCHVVVDPAWADVVGPPGDEERVMLQSAPAAPRTGSRLSCQIEAKPALHGLVLHVPAA
ncbi:MAG: 2Fe-2S iron-sulfur cluster-binding protein [Rubrivivax sp.]